MRSACTPAAPTIGSWGTGSSAGYRMNGLVCGPPSPPWNEISSSNAQPCSKARVVEAVDHDVGDMLESVGAP